MTKGIKKAKISEIFSSLQGEGLYCGKKQIFIRFSGCNLRCWYCDTKYAWDMNKAKEMSVDEILSEVETLADRDNVDSVCITGGESLLQTSVLLTLLPLLKRRFEIHLETNGTFVNEYIDVFKYIDVISLSFKFPSDCGKIFWGEYEFIIKKTIKESVWQSSKLSGGRNLLGYVSVENNLQTKVYNCQNRIYQVFPKKVIFVKSVIANRTKKEEVKRLIKILKDRKIPLVFQPVSLDSIVSKKIIEFINLASEDVHSLYLIPQMHKIWNIK